jgi:hypothetical protein
LKLAMLDANLEPRSGAAVTNWTEACRSLAGH